MYRLNTEGNIAVLNNGDREREGYLPATHHSVIVFAAAVVIAFAAVVAVFAAAVVAVFAAAVVAVFAAAVVAAPRRCC